LLLRTVAVVRLWACVRLTMLPISEGRWGNGGRFVLRVVVGASDVRGASTLTLHDGHTLHWDYLIVAAGAAYHYFGNDEWAEYAPEGGGRTHRTPALPGWFAWLTWLFVHLTFLVGLENRLLVFIQWAWNYFTRYRRAQLITGEPRTPALTAEQSSERKTTLR